MSVKTIIASLLCIVVVTLSPVLQAQDNCQSLKTLSTDALQTAIFEHDLPTLREHVAYAACATSTNSSANQQFDAIRIYLYLQDVTLPPPVSSVQRLLAQISVNDNAPQLALYLQLLAKYALHTDDVKQALALTHLLTSDIMPQLKGPALAYTQVAVADIHFRIGFFQSVRDLLTPLLSHEIDSISVQAAIHLWHTPRDETQLADVIALLQSDKPLTTTLTVRARAAFVLAKQAIEDSQIQLAKQLLAQAKALADQAGNVTLQTTIWLYEAQHGSLPQRQSAMTRLNALQLDKLASADQLNLATLNANRANEREDWQAASAFYEQAQSLNVTVSRNRALAREYASFQLIEQAKALESARQQSVLQGLQVEKQSQQQVIYLLALACSLLCLAIVVLLFIRKYKDAKRFEHLANTDGLTQVLNRRAVQDYAEQVRKEFLQTNKPFVLALADIDHFKSVNDTYGHDAGDIVLTTFAERAKLLIRQHDAVGRWGGEEWLFVLPTTEIAAAQGLFERLRKAVADVDIGTHTLNITFSMGAVQASGQSDITSLINQADELLYKAKRNGRDQLCIPNPKAEKDATSAAP